MENNIPKYKFYSNTIFKFNANVEGIDELTDIPYEASSYVYEELELLVGRYNYQTKTSIYRTNLFCKYYENNKLVYESNSKGDLKNRIIKRSKKYQASFLSKEFEIKLLELGYTTEGAFELIQDMITSSSIYKNSVTILESFGLPLDFNKYLINEIKNSTFLYAHKNIKK